MTQATTRLRGLLANASLYNAFQSLAGARSARRELAEKYIRAKPNDRLLDIGCGTGAILEHLPHVEYFGFDPSGDYVSAARKRFGRRGSFVQERVSTAKLHELPLCDIVLALGVIHHLDDDEAVALFDVARTAVREHGRVVTWDPCFAEKQSRLSRMLVGLDRGQNVRSEEQYRHLASRIFSRVRATVRHDLLCIPYTHMILECER